MTKSTYVITAAGGNGTAIQVLDKELSRAEYARLGAELGKKMEPYGAEQSGFLIPTTGHFEMSGGEFCGNASRSVAILLSLLRHAQSVEFTVSGYSGTVVADVQKTGPTSYTVSASFPGLPVTVKDVVVLDSTPAYLVDLGGIVHVLIEEAFPGDEAIYKAQHRSVVERLDLEGRDAVGVIWYQRQSGVVKIDPVVWVKAVDTFFYEQSCGSGSIAAATVTSSNSVRQPTGQYIGVAITGDVVTLKSNMEVTREEH